MPRCAESRCIRYGISRFLGRFTKRNLKNSIDRLFWLKQPPAHGGLLAFLWKTLETQTYKLG